jgi:hypothetical protein
MIFYLALASEDETLRFLQWADEHLAMQREAFPRSLCARDSGSNAIASGGHFSGAGFDHATGGRRFLGWTLDGTGCCLSAVNSRRGSGPGFTTTSTGAKRQAVPCRGREGCCRVRQQMADTKRTHQKRHARRLATQLQGPNQPDLQENLCRW